MNVCVGSSNILYKTNIKFLFLIFSRMAPSRKSQKSLASVTPSRESKSEGTRHRAEVEMRQHHAELFKHFERLLCYREALYNPDTKQKLFIVCAGKCLKSDCKSTATRHMVKVPMPRSSRHQFRDSIPLDFIGKRVVCFAHYNYDLQIQYLTTGSFPTDAKMIQFTKTSETKGPRMEGPSTECPSTEGPRTEGPRTEGPRHSNGALKKDDSWVKHIFSK